MVSLTFTLTPEACARLHDILVCLSKFSESVSIEAKRDRLSLTALNSSKSAYASFALDKNRFFSEYQCNAGKGADARFTCQIYNKAMLSVFKGRISDLRGRDTAIDRCEVSIKERPGETECRLVIKMVCNPGVIKTYKLTYEPVEVMHALFDKNSAQNRWTISSSVLREFAEYFGAKTEQLDIYAEDDRVTFTSFTEKITNGKEILKHPLRTAVSANKADFDRFTAEERQHIIINVRDFKAIVTHSETMRTAISAMYSVPGRPLQFSYGFEGIYSEFTLMTAGDGRAASTAPPPAPVQPPSVANTNVNSAAQSFSRNSTTSEDNYSDTSRTGMPPPRAPASRSSARRTLRPTGTARSTIAAGESEVRNEPDTLFVQQDEDDTQWDPNHYEDEDGYLGWDANADNVSNRVDDQYRMEPAV